MGIPDRSDYGDPGSIEPGSVLDYFIQEHEAERAGRHYDLRAGTPETGLYSWATKKELPDEPGGRIALYQQPVHAHAYGGFSGEIGRGYGKGKVQLKRQGKLLITRSTPDAIHFSTAGPGPVVKRYALVKPRGPNDKSWLLVRAGMPGKPITEKESYKNLDPDQAEDVLRHLQDNATVQPKIDGALAFIRIAKNRAEILSHRTSKRTGQPIVHTERFFGQIPQMKYPKDLENSLLAGEVYGERGGKAIPAQELGGILNAGVARSLEKQKEQDVQMRAQLFGVKELGGKPADLPYSRQREILQNLLPLLPRDQFVLPEEARTSEDALAMFERIRKGKHPLTREGIVIHPEQGEPMKSKFRPEHDVVIRDIFPGQGKYKDIGAGGFRYSYEPEGPVVGRLGTGLTDELRRELWEHPELYLGRTARVAAHDKFPSGALRVPSLIALHEG